MTLVRITNFVGITTRLGVNCGSNEGRETGVKMLPPMASFEFNLNSKSEVYTCIFQWPGFAYRFELDKNRAKYEQNCWIITNSDGPCLCDCQNAKCDLQKDCHKWVAVSYAP